MENITDTSNFAQGGVWFLWSLSSDFQTNTTLERSSLLITLSLERIDNGTERRSLGFLGGFLAWLANQLIDCWHNITS